MTAGPDDSSVARARIDRLRATNPAAATLATLLSTAVRIEPALIRRVRLLLPAADVGAELDLWNSDILGSASPLALSLDPSCAECLREDLAGPGFDGLRERVGDVIEASHADSHWSLRLEERINRVTVNGSPDAEQLLYAAVGELRSGSSDADPAPVARWLLAALNRIPRSLADTEAGTVAELSAGTHLDGRFVGRSGTSSAMDAWMPWLLATAGVGQRQVPIRFSAGLLVVNQPGTDLLTVGVPDTDPMTLDASWNDGTTAHHQRIVFRAGDIATVAVPGDEVELESLTGDRWRLVLPRHGVRSGLPVPGFTFSPVRWALRPCLGRDDLRDRVLTLMRRDAARVTLTGAAGSGKTVLLGAVLDRLEAEGLTVLQHFYGVEDTWDTPDLVGASLRAKFDVARRPAVLPGARRALLVTTTSEIGPADRQTAEARNLADALADPDIGSFDVETRTSRAARGQPDLVLREAFAGGADGLSLVVLSCRVHLDVRGEISFQVAGFGRDPSRLSDFSAAELVSWIDEPVAGTVVVMLDCRNSTHFGVDQHVRDMVLPRFERHHPTGARAVLASVAAKGERSLTRVVLDGLSTGDADSNGDGVVTLDDLFTYVRLHLSEVFMSASGNRSVVIAKNPRADRRIVVALDDAPAEPAPEVSRILAEFPDARMIVTSRERRDGIRIEADVRDDLERVCAAMVDHHRDALALAFGLPPAETRFGLVSAAGLLPGRLAAIIGWLLDQPVGTADLAEVPPSFTTWGAGVWDRLAQPPWIVLALVASARSATTMAELIATVAAARRATGLEAESPDDVVTDVVGLADERLVRLDGPAGEPETVVSVSHPSVAAEVSARQPLDGHATHVAAFPYADPSVAMPSQLADAAHHHARTGDVGGIVRLVRCGGYLDLRQRTAGVDALTADLAELAARSGRNAEADLLHRVVTGLAEQIRAAPESFVDLVHNGLSAEGAATLARDIFRDWQKPGLGVRTVYAVEPARPLWHDDGPALAAVRWPDGAIVTVSGDSVHRYSETGRPSSAGGPPLDASVPVLAGVFGPDVLIAQRGGVWLNDTVLSAGEADVTSLFARADSDQAAVGRRDGTVTRFVRTATGADPQTLLGHRGAVTAIVRSGPELLTAGSDGTVRIWSPDGTVARIYQRHHAPVVALAAIGDDEVISADEKGRLRWWTVASCTDVGVLGTHAGRVTAIAVAADGTPVTAGVDGAVRLWDLGGGDRPLRTSGPPVLALATSRWDHVAVWTADGLLTVWRLDGTEVWTRRPDAVGEPVRALVFDDYGTLMVAHTGGVVAYRTDGPSSSGRYLDALALDLNHSSVIAGTADGSATVDLVTGTVRPQPATAPVTSVAATTQGTVVAVDAGGNVLTGTAMTDAGFRRVFIEHSFHRAGRFWVQGVSGDLGLLERLDPVTVGTARVRADADGTAFAAFDTGDGRWVAAGGRHGTVALTRLGVVPEVATLRVGAGAVRALAFTRSGPTLVIGTEDGSVHRYDLDGSAPVLIGRHRAAVTGLAICGLVGGSADPSYRDRVVSCGADGTVRVWDPTTGASTGIAAGRVGFRAVDAKARTVAARDDEGRLWVLDVDEPVGVAPQDLQVILMSQQSRRDSDRLVLSVDAELRMPVPMDLRAVALTADRPLWTVPGTTRLTMDQRFVPTTDDGTLLVPRRIGPVCLFEFRLSQRLRPGAPPPDETSLRLSVSIPGSTDLHIIQETEPTP